MLELIQLRKNKVHQFQPKVEIFSEKGPFILKTVTNSRELKEALRLRYQVFHREMLGRKKMTGIDVDSYDFFCDHLVIIDKKSNAIVGTYRLNCSLFNQHFYSAQEFNLRRILEQPGVKLELGRACIHQDYRRGIVISMLWRGIAEYMNKVGADILFGCASIKSESPRAAALVYRHFEIEERMHDSYLCAPTLKFKMPSLDLWINNLNRPLTAEESAEVENLIPSLCKSYLRAGAWIAGEPAYDEEFHCIDFLTILKRENLTRALWRKYNLEETATMGEPQTLQMSIGS